MIWLLLAHAAWAGTITGTVRAEGKPGVEAAAAGGGYESRKLKFAERINYAALQDFVVYIEGSLGKPDTNAPAPTVVVDTRRSVSQKGAMFSPHVLPVLVGTAVEWPNHDEIFHNVFSVSEVKPFDLGLYKHPEIKRVTFDKAGRVDAFCSIHSSMHCIVLVLENRFYSTTDGQGRYRIAGVPAGKYKLRAWHERLPSQVLDVTVPEAGDVQVEFVLGIKNLPQY